MKKLSFIGVLFLCVFVCITSAHALGVIYSYIGTPFTYIQDDEPWPPGTYSSTDRVEFNMTTVDGPLADGVYDFVSLPPLLTAWDCNDGRNFFSSTDTGANLNVSVVGGEIAEWNLLFNWFIEPLPPGAEYGTAIIATQSTANVSGGVPFVGSFDSAVTVMNYVDGPLAPFDDIGTAYTKGSWTSSPVPEPTTMLLFGAGLLGLAGFGRKKFKK